MQFQYCCIQFFDLVRQQIICDGKVILNGLQMRGLSGLFPFLLGIPTEVSESWELIQTIGATTDTVRTVN